MRRRRGVEVNRAYVLTGRDGSAGGQPSLMQIRGVSHRTHERGKKKLSSSTCFDSSFNSNSEGHGTARRGTREV